MRSRKFLHPGTNSLCEVVMCPRRYIRHSNLRSAPPQSTGPYPFFKLPAVMDAQTFITSVRRQARALQRYDQSLSKRKENPSSPSSTPTDIDLHDPEWQPLTSYFTIPFLEHELWERRALKSDMLSTLLVPYKAAKELILEGLPDRYKDLATQELAYEGEVLTGNAKIRKDRADAAAAASKGHSITLDNIATTSQASKQENKTSQQSSSAPTPDATSAQLRPVPANKIVQYKDWDVYGDRRPMRNGTHRRLPIVCVMGHIDHGKTTLLDTVMASNMCAREAGKITQSVRCFTVDVKVCVGQLEALNVRRLAALGISDPSSNLPATEVAADPFAKIQPTRYATYPSAITFVDTPGHKVFAEMRFHSQLAADFVVLIVALDEGIQGQTLEVLHVALNMDRPIIVVFNKTDKFTDTRLLATAIVGAVQSLAKEGLKIKLVSSFDELDALKKSPRSKFHGQASLANAYKGFEDAESQLLSKAPIAPFLSRTLLHHNTNQQPQPSTTKKSGAASASMRDPILDSGKLQRRSLGICLSGKSGANVDLLLEVLRCGAQLLNPAADASPSAKVQAQVLEASKTTEQTEQRELHGRFAETRQRAVNLSASSSDLQKEMAAQGAGGMGMAANAADRALRGYSTSQVVITAIVKSGTLKVGMPFVADQCYGTVAKLCDYWGRSLKVALPGTAVVIVDDKSQSGCPGVGTHVIGVQTPEQALAVNTLRRHLAWFIEAFPKRTELLRPTGMDTSFKAVGNFGQMDQKVSEKSLEYRLLYGGGKDEKEGSPDSSGGTGDTQQPSDKMPSENKAAEAVAPSSTVEGTPAEIEARWAALQLEKMPETKEEMEELQQNGKVVGIYCKVDSWHSARILQREIPRLSTKHIFLSVLGIKFGELKAEDTQDFINNSKVVLCYRTPRLQCPKTYRNLELLNFYFLETDVYSEIVTYLKTIVIHEHEKFVKERGSLKAQRFAEATKNILSGIGIAPSIGKRRGLQALTRAPADGNRGPETVK